MRCDSRTMATNSAYTQKLAGFAFSFGDVLLELDPQGTITWSLGRVDNLFGATEPSIQGKGLLDFVPKADHAPVKDYLSRIRDNERPNPIELKLNGGDRDPVQVILSGIFLEQMKDSYLLAFRRKGSHEAAARKPGSWRKPDESEDFAQRVLALGQEQDNKDSSLSFIHLEDFKQFRDELGDEERQVLEQAILTLLKRSALDDAAVASLGAGRYGVMHDGAVGLAEIKGGVVGTTKDFDESGRGLNVAAASLALSLLNGQAGTVDALAGVLRKIKNRPSESMKAFEHASALEDLINKARDDYNLVKRRLNDKSFSLAFQPIVNLETRTPHHFEVLTRFTDSKESPFAFICAAENAGLIKDFDYLICEKVTAWKRDPANAKTNADLAVNLSALSVQDAAFVADLQRLMAGLGDLRQTLHFEITETGQIEDIEGINGVIQDLRADGHKIYLDDFGVGQTSLQQLRKWDIDAVKIDGSYVRDALSDISTRHILKAMASLCNDLDVDCVAEMIENEETTRYLRKCGIKYGQGYYFGKPDKDISAHLK